MLSLNVKKAHSMLISSMQKHVILKNQNKSWELAIQGAELEVVQTSKYLGVQVDNILDWREHINKISTKVSRAIGSLEHARFFLPEESLRTLYAVLWNLIFAAVLQFEIAVVQLKLTSCRKCSTVMYVL